MAYDFDLIILGSGPSGFSCAMQASKFGKSVMLVESNPTQLGGAWINTGTVPSKTLREAAGIISKYASEFGRDKRKPYQKFPMAELLRYKQEIQAYENEELAENLRKNNITIARGLGMLTDPHTVAVTSHNDERSVYTAAFILVATGSRPSAPEHVHIDHQRVIDSLSLLNLDHVPSRLVINGSGINAVEYATIFASLGSKVTILNETPQFLPFLDHEIHDELDQLLEAKGIIVYNEVTVTAVAVNDLRNCTEVRFHIHDPKQERVIETEHILQLGTRTPNTDRIGLKELGVAMNAEGFIRVDTHFRSNIPSIYATGDVIGLPGQASTSFTQGQTAACHMFDILHYEVAAEIPYGIYGIPELSGIGMTEAEAKATGARVGVGRARFRNLTKASISNNKDGLLKLIFDADSLQLLGVHIIGESACDLIHLAQAVMGLQGDVRYFTNHVFNYPTYAEAYRQAAFNGLTNTTS